MNTDSSISLYEYQKQSITHICLDELKNIVESKIESIIQKAQNEYSEKVHEHFDKLVNANSKKFKVFQKNITLKMAEDELNDDFPIKRFLEINANEKKEKLTNLYNNALENNELNYQDAKKILGDDIDKLFKTKNL